MIGTSLGPYKILEPLGAGGMGEVYLGEDTRLGRKVAIKVLPPEFASDPERLARFEQEARAAAALNHPHIAVVHDIGTEGDTHFMVQEYLEGQSLRERLDKGALPLDEALDLAIEVGEALIAAHKAGIIHRDLKPDNIFVTEEGHAKVLDFGLAKLTEVAAPVGSELSMSPTMLGTVAGQVMGTAGYMAPEQVNGEEVDHRADLFAFGTVCYEMVTGRRAFVGENVHDILSRIISRQPEPVHEVRRDLPLKLSWILDKALTKDPGRRYQTAYDLTADLRQLLDDLASGTVITGVASPTPGAEDTPAKKPGLPWSLAAPLGLAIALLGALAAWYSLHAYSGPPKPVTRFAIGLPEGLRLRSALGAVAVSPDGKHVAYVGTPADLSGRMLFLRSMDQLKEYEIDGTEGAARPFFSPDSQWIGFSNGSDLMKVNMAGGEPFELCGSCVDTGSDGDWAPDGETIILESSDSLWQVSASGGDPTLLATPDLENGEIGFERPDVLPGGNAVLIEIQHLERDLRSIAVLDLATLQKRIVIEDGMEPWYSETGHIIYSRGDGLFAVAFDSDTHEIVGEPTPVLQGTAGTFGFSQNGTLVFVPGSSTVNARRLVWVDRNGVATPFSDRVRAFGRLSLSPDGHRVAVEIADEGGTDIWVLNETTDVISRLTFEGASTPVWSSDGEWVAYRSSRDGVEGIYRSFPDRPGREPELMVSGNGAPVGPTDVSVDGASLLFLQLSPSTNWDVKALPLDDVNAGPIDAPSTPGSDSVAVFSPDREWIAFASLQDGRRDVWVAEFPGPGVRRQVSSDGGSTPVWSRDGRVLFYVGSGRSQMMVVDITTEPALETSVPRPLFPLGNMIGFLAGNNRRYSVTEDGQRFIMVRPEETTEGPDEINVVLNWFEELKERVPTGGS